MRVHPLAVFGPLCGTGWLELWLPVVEKAAELNIHLVKIEERHGTMRIVPEVYHPELQIVLEAAEDMSAKTCEYCGDTGTLCHNGLQVLALCEKHASHMGFAPSIDEQL